VGKALGLNWYCVVWRDATDVSAALANYVATDGGEPWDDATEIFQLIIGGFSVPSFAVLGDALTRASFAGLLVVDATALKSLTESVAITGERMAFAQLVAAFFNGPIAIRGMLSGLKTSAELLLALLELLTARIVVFLLNIAQADPPHFSRTVHTFSSRLLQGVMSGFDLRMVFGKRDYHRAALTQRILVNVQFFLRYAIG